MYHTPRVIGSGFGSDFGSDFAFAFGSGSDFDFAVGCVGVVGLLESVVGKV